MVLYQNTLSPFLWREIQETLTRPRRDVMKHGASIKSSPKERERKVEANGYHEQYGNCPNARRQKCNERDLNVFAYK